MPHDRSFSLRFSISFPTQFHEPCNSALPSKDFGRDATPPTPFPHRPHTRCTQHGLPRPPGRVRRKLFCLQIRSVFFFPLPYFSLLALCCYHHRFGNAPTFQNPPLLFLAFHSVYQILLAFICGRFLHAYSSNNTATLGYWSAAVVCKAVQSMIH
ncbi:hypothetical protein LY78DRAFT_119347 [Colletotrichum sublineola]|nr:hypothetical protein LY78DRAFT_119347 [Colletotrichum sublineola]